MSKKENEVLKNDSTVNSDSNINDGGTGSEKPVAPQNNEKGAAEKTFTESEIDKIVAEKVAKALKAESKKRDKESEAPANENAKTNDSVSEKEENIEAFMNERIPYKAFKDDREYKDDVHVVINGKAWVIKRGITVMLPRYVIQVLESKDRELMTLNRYIEEAERKGKEF